jgi:two-component system cell cycle sensor histidine kinase/response regulator CckA
MARNWKSILARYGFSLIVFIIVAATSSILLRYSIRINFTIPVVVGLVAVTWYGGRRPGYLMALLVMAASIASNPISSDTGLASWAFGHFTVFTLLIFVVLTISGRKSAETRLLESSERYRLLFENNPFPMWVCDPETSKFLAVNHEATVFYQYSSKEFLGMSIEDIRLDSNLPIISPEFTKVNRPKNGLTIQKHRRKDGSVTEAEVTSQELVFGGRMARLVVAKDITERRRAQQKLVQSEEKYRDLVENAHDIIYSHDLDGNYTSINAAGEEITGYNLSETLRMNVADIVAPEHIAKAREMIANKLAGQNGPAYEVDIIAKDGHRLTIELNTSLVRHDGVPVGIQGIARDITEYKLLIQQLAQAQKIESIGRLAGGIAHDFNNMLTAINGYSEMVLRQLSPEDPIRPNVEEIKKAGQRSALLTSQLLAFSRKQVLHPEKIQINDAIKEIGGMLKRMIGEDLELTTCLSPAVGSIEFDPSQLSQIIMNLAVNARDAMPNGGKLTIETSNVFLDPEYASRHVGVLPGAYVLLSVSDTGTGMSPEVQEQVFEPFFTTKEVGKGTGLGLSTVYGIVRQSGGNVLVYSEIDRGSTFKVYIPRTADETTAVVMNAEQSKLAIGNETILLVEDEDMVRALSRQILQSCGYTVIEASDGIEALEIYNKCSDKIDLLITDVVMPRLGGRELAEKLLKRTPALRILFASGYTDDAVVRHGVLETNINFIQKPFNLDDVARKVRNLLDTK